MPKENYHFKIQNGLVRIAVLEDISKIISFYKINQTHLCQFSDPQLDSFYTDVHWIEEIKRRAICVNDKTECRFFIFSPDQKEILGFCNFFNIIRGAFHSCYLGYGLSKTVLGKGIMKESLEVLCDFMFNRWNLHRIMANYDPLNVKSENTLLSLGFTKEGYAKDYLYYHGKWNDHTLSSLINKNWQITNVKE